MAMQIREPCIEDARTMQLSYVDTLLYTVFLVVKLQSSLPWFYSHQLSWPNSLKPLTPQEVILPEVIYRLTSNAAWVGFHSSRTRPISKGLSKYMKHWIGGYLIYNPWSFDHSGTQPPYLKKKNNTVGQGGTRMGYVKALPPPPHLVWVLSPALSFHSHRGGMGMAYKDA